MLGAASFPIALPWEPIVGRRSTCTVEGVWGPFLAVLTFLCCSMQEPPRITGVKTFPQQGGQDKEVGRHILRLQLLDLCG